MNSVSLVGRAGQDPNVRYLDSGKVVCTITLAVDRVYKKEGKPTCDWFSLELWGKTAEVAANYVHKGSKVGVTGRIELEEYQAKDGTTKAKAVVKVNELSLLDPKPQGQAGGAPSQSQYYDEPF